MHLKSNIKIVFCQRFNHLNLVSCDSNKKWVYTFLMPEMILTILCNMKLKVSIFSNILILLQAHAHSIHLIVIIPLNTVDSDLHTSILTTKWFQGRFSLEIIWCHLNSHLSLICYMYDLNLVIFGFEKIVTSLFSLVCLFLPVI